MPVDALFALVVHAHEGNAPDLLGHAEGAVAEEFVRDHVAFLEESSAEGGEEGPNGRVHTPLA